MIQNISNILLESLLASLREGKSDTVILCLTYYQRYCSKYLTQEINVLICLTYSLTHFKNNNIKIAENYLGEAAKIVKGGRKGSDLLSSLIHLQRLLQVMEGVICIGGNNLNKAKFIFNEMISEMTEAIHL